MNTGDRLGQHPALSKRDHARHADSCPRNGYRFAKDEGESIVTIAEKCLKTWDFCDSTRGARALRSRSIHRDA
ncbi:hypothetical protein HNQ36_001503 [Afipia massiliensis]|uniref:Uncharacterized protein n=1 Tax=Afipia massiliensis TaxID=211460 RepID=A0A840MT16_9BRAD|nr:hypothetical protein [Afipia massiliensis]MBB5051549.1 hypothetical protein [Afipia massiliensis]